MKSKDKLLSIVITTVENESLVNYHIRMLKRYQVYRNFETVVVNDSANEIEVPLADRVINIGEQTGAANARNIGASASEGSRVLFVGDDCVPQSALALYHAMADEFDCVQGFSPFHPSVMTTDFMVFLNRSGLQANWEGVWGKKAVNGYCLTTNFSVNKDVFEQYKFDTRFKSAAWEDVEFGYRLANNGIRTVFQPRASNLHHHYHDFLSFRRRQENEGKWRVEFCKIHPEMTQSLIPLKDLKAIGQTILSEITDTPVDRTIKGWKEQQENVWRAKLNAASLVGLRDEMKRDEITRIALSLKLQESLIFVFEILKGISLKNHGWVGHNIGWMLSKGANVATYLIASHAEMRLGNRETGALYAQKAQEIMPTPEGRSLLQ